MRTTARFAVVLTTALLAVSTIGTASAQTIKNQSTSGFVERVLLATTDTKSSDPEIKPAEATTSTPEAAPAPPAPTPVMVTVNAGDSLSSIAETHATTWVRLFNANEFIANPNVINPGDQVRIPGANEQLNERPLPQPVVAAPAPTYAAPVTTYSRPAQPAASYPVSANAAKAYIYSRESGNNPNATNPTGCYGLGQDCNGVLRSTCGADYACQDAYFDGYAQRRYGGWEGAYAFWQQNHWW